MPRWPTVPLAAILTCLGTSPRALAELPDVDRGGREHVLQLPTGSLFAHDVAPEATWVDLLVHFHGDPETARRQFRQAGVRGVLVTVNFRGLSSAYSKPFQQEDLFEQITAQAMDGLRRESIVDHRARWRRICISSFSAGYGAAREILKQPRYVDQIDGILVADSIYAGFVGDPSQRHIDPQNMVEFRRFAELAAAGRKTFLVTHSYLVPPTYASTAETADDLISHISGKSREVREPGPGTMRLVRRADLGNFHVYGYAGVDGAAHMQHLRHLGHWMKSLPLELVATRGSAFSDIRLSLRNSCQQSPPRPNPRRR